MATRRRFQSFAAVYCRVWANRPRAAPAGALVLLSATAALTLWSPAMSSAATLNSCDTAKQLLQQEKLKEAKSIFEGLAAVRTDTGLRNCGEVGLADVRVAEATGPVSTTSTTTPMLCRDARKLRDRNLDAAESLYKSLAAGPKGPTKDCGDLGLLSVAHDRADQRSREPLGWWSRIWTNGIGAELNHLVELLAVLVVLYTIVTIASRQRWWRRLRRFDWPTAAPVLVGALVADAALWLIVVEWAEASRYFLILGLVPWIIVVTWWRSRAVTLAFGKIGSDVATFDLAPSAQAQFQRLAQGPVTGLTVVNDTDLTSLPAGATVLSDLTSNASLKAVLSVFRSLLPTTDYRVVGYVVGTGDAAQAHVMLRRGREVVDAATLSASQLLTASARGAPGPKPEVDDKSWERPLSIGVAAWSLLAMSRERQWHLERELDGATHWEGIALQTIAGDLHEAGANDAAREALARAIDSDPMNKSATYGNATLLAPASSDLPAEVAARRLSIRRLSSLVEGYRGERFVTATELRARYSLTANYLDLAIRLSSDPSTLGQAPGALIEALIAGHNLLVTLASIGAMEGLPAATGGLRRTPKPGVKQFAQSVAPIALICIAGIRVEMFGNTERSRQYVEALTAPLTLRARYNRACFHCSVANGYPVADPRHAEALALAWDDFYDATDQRRLASFAVDDPSFGPLRDSPQYRVQFRDRIRAHQVSVDRHHSLSDLTIIGAHAAALAKHGVKTPADLVNVTTGPGELTELADELGISVSTVRRWRHVAEMIERVDGGLGIASANLLIACGITSVGALGGLNDAEELHQRLKDANAANRQLARLPGVGVVRGWIAAAG